MLTIATLLQRGQFALDPPQYDLKIPPLPTNAPANNFRLRRLQ